MSAEHVRLHPDDLAALAEAVAGRVADLLRQTPADPRVPALVDAATVARALGVTRETIYANAVRLGARRLGDGPRARLRFDLAEAVEAWTSRQPSERSESTPDAAREPKQRRRRASRSGNGLDSVPIRELQPRPIHRSGPGTAATVRGPATRGRSSPRTQRTPPRGESAAVGGASSRSPDREEHR